VLDAKLERIASAFRGVQATPEDIRSLVLGQMTEREFTDLVIEAGSVSIESFDDWFDKRTAELGGQDLVAAVQGLLGHTAKFDFGIDAPNIPQVDLPDLEPFLRASLRLHQRRLVRQPNGTVAFDVPDSWRKSSFLIPARYDAVHFDRSRPPAGNEVLFGAGSIAFESAISEAAQREQFTTASEAVTSTLVAFTVRDSVDDLAASIRQVVLGVEMTAPPRLLADWQLIQRLNGWLEHPDSRAIREAAPVPNGDANDIVDRATEFAVQTLGSLSLPFARPVVSVVGIVFAREMNGG
jgi:hypothetical protein